MVQAGDPLGWLVWALVGLVVIAGLISGFSHYLLQRTGEGVVLSSRRRLVARMLHLPISQFDTRRTGDLVSRVGSDTTLLRAVLTQGLVEAIGGALTFVGALIAMLIIDPLLLGLTVLVVAVAIVTVVTLSARIRVASREAQERVGIARGSRRARRSRQCAPCGHPMPPIARSRRSATRRRARGVPASRSRRISALVVPVAGIAMQVSFLVVLGVGGFRVASGAITVANLVAFILFLFMMIMPLGQAFGAITAVNSALGALGRIQEIIDLPGEREGDEADRAAPRPIRDRCVLCRFHDVSFEYSAGGRRRTGPGAGGSLVRGEARPADRARRPIGCGQEHDPRADRAVLRSDERASCGWVGSTSAALDRTALRAQIGYVEQDAPVLAGTLRDNLLLSSPEATDESASRCCAR